MTAPHTPSGPTLWAVADLHAAVRANQEHIEAIGPRTPEDWLIVAGDVAENIDLVTRVMGRLAERFSTVVWAPGNHELFSRSFDRYRGVERYGELVRRMRKLGVVTPEDPYPVFHGVTVAPLFTLYDYSFRAPGCSVAEALEAAKRKSLMLTDEFTIAPFVDIRAWCWERLAYTTRRLSRVDGPTILVNHWPLVREPVDTLRYPEIGLWCGTRHTRSWARRYNARAVVYGHLHMPGEVIVDGIPHIEASLGYPREWGSPMWPGTGRPWPYPVMEAGA
ncbi:metallophosphoesterase family protein [Corynebacterium liangguodongii]|uniref:Serine/threonine protein phosphatase n=1 Tax=Corynebacterium liangguodongii TaxID=2079535 RepID=A0A2S0WEP3_9CORY|nr:metallophosphoesterase [Corynebacterium liangguodongii]AWB84220.1 serine/threonine protein phosphatase [Corynebacterium liangguodongii]PWC00230.1 metallophosphoesterase [Corynebacterium liangguodongii]